MPEDWAEWKIRAWPRTLRASPNCNLNSWVAFSSPLDQSDGRRGTIHDAGAHSNITFASHHPPTNPATVDSNILAQTSTGYPGSLSQPGSAVEAAVQTTDIIKLLQSTTEHILTEHAASLHAAIRETTGSQDASVVGVFEAKIRQFVQAWIMLIRYTKHQQLGLADDSLPSWMWSSILSVYDPTSVTEETEHRPNRQSIQNTSGKVFGQPDCMDSSTSGTVEPSHNGPRTAWSCAQNKTSPAEASEHFREHFDRSHANTVFDELISPASLSPLSFGSVGVSPDTDDTDDTNTSSSCADFPWLSSGLALDTARAHLALKPAAMKDLIGSYHAWTRGELDFQANPSTGSLSQHIGEGHIGKRKLEDDQQQHAELKEQGGPATKRARKQVPEGEARLACHF